MIFLAMAILLMMTSLAVQVYAQRGGAELAGLCKLLAAMCMAIALVRLIVWLDGL